MLALIIIPLLLFDFAELILTFRVGSLINALLLGIGVSFAEELIFRGWLLGELNHLYGLRISVLGQAGIFSLAHIRFDVDFGHMVGLFIGLYLFGIVLGLTRIRSSGSLWACIGLHGGLVGGWFFVNTCLLDLSSQPPAWIVGHGSVSPNPISGLLCFLYLGLILLNQLTAFARAERP